MNGLARGPFEQGWKGYTIPRTLEELGHPGKGRHSEWQPQKSRNKRKESELRGF